MEIGKHTVIHNSEIEDDHYLHSQAN